MKMKKILYSLFNVITMQEKQMICILKTLRKIYKNGNKLFKQDSNFFKILGLKKDNKNMVRRLPLKLKSQHLTVQVTCAHRQF